MPQLNQRSYFSPVSTAVALTFAAFVASIPFETVFMEEDPTTGQSLYTLSKFFGYAFFIAALSQARTIFKRPHFVVGLLAIYLATSTLRGLIANDNLRRVLLWELSTAQMIVLLWAGSHLFTIRRVALVVFLGFVGSCATLSILQLLAITPVAYDDMAGRMSAFAEDPNSLGSLLALGIVAAIGLGLDNWIVSPWVRWVTMGLSIPIALPLVRTGSRGAVVALAGGLLTYAITKGRSVVPRLRNVALVGGLIFLVGYASQKNEDVMQRWEYTLSRGDMAEREDIAPLAVNLILERPFFGWGLFVNFEKLGEAFGQREKDTHNLLLFILTEVGAIGGATYILALVIVFVAAYRATRSGHAIYLALIVTLSLVNSSLTWHTRKLQWVILALALSLCIDRGRPHAETGHVNH